MIPVTRPRKTSPPAWNRPMNHSAPSARAPKKPVGSSTCRVSAATAMSAARGVNGMIAPVESASREGQSVMLAWHLMWSSSGRARSMSCLRCRSWAPPRGRPARVYGQPSTSRAACSVVRRLEQRRGLPRRLAAAAGQVRRSSRSPLEHVDPHARSARAASRPRANVVKPLRRDRVADDAVARRRRWRRTPGRRGSACRRRRRSPCRACAASRTSALKAIDCW